MTVVVLVPGQAEPWQVANGAFRLIVERLRQSQISSEDLQVVLQAQALHLLDLSSTDTASNARIARALAEAAQTLRDDLVRNGKHDQWEAELVEQLGVLSMWMEGLT